MSKLSSRTVPSENKELEPFPLVKSPSYVRVDLVKPLLVVQPEFLPAAMPFAHAWHKGNVENCTELVAPYARLKK